MRALPPSHQPVRAEEARSAAIRQQAAIVRTIADQVELLPPGRLSDALRAQLYDEQARLHALEESSSPPSGEHLVGLEELRQAG